MALAACDRRPVYIASTWEEPERYIEAKDWDAIAEWETAYWADGPGQPKDRVPGSVAAALGAIAQGVQIVRVHDVAATRQAMAVWRAVLFGTEKDEA